MSYILDALKKSEAQRHAGRIPTVAAAEGVMIEPPRASRFGLLAWIVVALAVALGALWWARRYLDRPLQDMALSPAAALAPHTAAPARADNAAAPASSGSHRGGEVDLRLKPEHKLAVREQRAAPATEAAAKPLAQPPRGPVAPVPARESPPPVPARESPAPSPARGSVLRYADLPPAIRQGLPALIVGGFATGESGGTLVMVDDKLVREGDEVAPGIRVERILSDTAEFSYRGYRFRR